MYLYQKYINVDCPENYWLANNSKPTQFLQYTNYAMPNNFVKGNIDVKCTFYDISSNNHNN